MPIYHKELEYRFRKFPRTQQLLMICNELNRVKHVLNDKDDCLKSLYRALELMDWSSASGNWGKDGLREMRRGREVIASFTVKEKLRSLEIDQLIKVLVAFDVQAFTMLYPPGEIEK